MGTVTRRVISRSIIIIYETNGGILARYAAKQDPYPTTNI